MTFIEQLLNGENVEWKKLGEVCETVTDFTAAGSFASNAKNVKYLKEPNFALLVRTTDLKQNFKNRGNFVYIDQHAFEYLWRVNLNKDSVILPNVGNCGEVYYIQSNTLPYKHCALAPNALLLRSNIENNRFLYFLFQCHFFQKQLSKITSSTGQTKFNKTNLKQLLIPLPPLSVQHRIVEILDKFTELEAELDCRKRQYEYYRNQLLSFDILNRGQKLNDVKIMTLGEIGTFVRGSGLQKKDFTPTGVGCIHYGQIYTYYGTYAKKTKSFVSQEFALKARKAKHGDLIIATTSENDEDVCKAVAWLGDEDIAVSSDACFYAHTMNPKYIAYYFQTELFQSQKRKFITGTKVRRVNAKDLAKIKIPLPPLSVQREIVEILDKFDTLTNSISEGLPKEIELRRKQYEYYRNQLLSFSTVKEKYHG